MAHSRNFRNFTWNHAKTLLVFTQNHRKSSFQMNLITIHDYLLLMAYQQFWAQVYNTSNGLESLILNSTFLEALSEKSPVFINLIQSWHYVKQGNLLQLFITFKSLRSSLTLLFIKGNFLDKPWRRGHREKGLEQVLLNSLVTALIYLENHWKRPILGEK